MAKKIRGVKVPKKILGLKLRKGTRKDIAFLVKKVRHPDARSLVLAATAALGPMLAERIAARKGKIKPAR